MVAWIIIYGLNTWPQFQQKYTNFGQFTFSAGHYIGGMNSNLTKYKSSGYVLMDDNIQSLQP